MSAYHPLHCDCNECRYSMGLASMSPAKRLSTVQALLNPPVGMDPLISPEEARRLLDMPDLGEDLTPPSPATYDYAFIWLDEHGNERRERMAPPVKHKPALPSVDAIARAFFEVDPEVHAFVCAKSEAPDPIPQSDYAEHKRRYDAVAQRAWDLDESGWRTKWLDRAFAAHDLLSSMVDL